MPIYLKFEPEIKGEVTTKDFEGQIEITSFQFGAGRGISTPHGTASREASVPSFSEITLSKTMDVSSTLLLKESTEGEPSKATLSFITTGKSNNLVFLKIELEGVLISGYSVSSGGDGRPSESISLNYAKINYKYMFDNKGEMAAQAPEFIWNLQTATQE